MIGGDTAVTIPKLSRQNGVYKKTVATLDNQKNLQTKYRWLWMTKSNEETVWCVYARSAFWFFNYRSCKENALQQEIHSPFDTAIRLDVEIYNGSCIRVVENLTLNGTDVGADEAVIQNHLNTWKRPYSEE